ncbi:MAG: PRC-barrel domain-containing protein [Desulfobulbaceae bacterium]|nr:PRC-barrel domain-containing protein [Desulfobulbaceae bacterium]
MNKTTISLITVMAAFLLTSSAYATGEQSDPYGTGEQSDNSAGAQGQSDIPYHVSFYSADELKGMKVINQNGEEIGQIEDANTDSQTGQINYVTLSRGGVLGVGEDQIVAPVEAFSFDREQQRAQLKVDESKLDNVPAQADMDDKSFERQLESHYGVSPAWEDEQQDQNIQMDDTEMEMDEENKTEY